MRDTGKYADSHAVKSLAGNCAVLPKKIRPVLMVHMRSSIFHQTIPIEETRVAPLPMKLVKYDGKLPPTIKARAMNPAVLP